MRNKIRTTIVIPNYNGLQFMEKCLNAIYQEKSTIFRVLIVDNGSKDNSLAVVHEKFPQVEVILFQENHGFCKAVNEGIKATKTEFVLLLNNDTEIEEGFLPAMEKAMDRSEHIFSVSAKMVTMNDPKIMDGAGDYYTALGWAYARGKGKSATLYQKPKRVFAACAGAAIYRKEILDKIGCFDEKHFAYLEDMDIGYRGNIYGYTNWYEPKAVVKHVGSGASGSRYNEFKIMLSSKNSVYLIYKNMPLIQIIFNIPFLITGFFIKYIFFLRKGYGSLYLKGLMNGLKICVSKESNDKKVKYEFKNTINYVRIQIYLWINLLRRLG